MDLYDFTALVGGGKEKIVEYLQDARILRREVYCQPCQRDYTMVKNKVSIVGYMLRCPGCHRKRQLQTGTFLEGSRLQVNKFVGLLFLWAHEAPIKMVLSMTGVSSVTAVQWYHYFRDICSWKLVHSRSREDRSDRRKRDGKGKVSPGPPAACQTVLGVWDL